MEFNLSPADKSKRAEFQTQEFCHQQLRVKKIMQENLIKALDELAEIRKSNAERIINLEKLINDSIPYSTKKVYQDGIVKYENLSVLANKVSEIYLMLLDIYTYGTFIMLARDEWDWRAFARHFYTMLYEHSKTVNRHLNDILRILKENIGESYDFIGLVHAKKEFSAFIADKSEIAKQIRVNVDAHFDGDFIERLGLIQNLSYTSVITLYYEYNTKMHAFLATLEPALKKFRLSADTSYHALK